LRQILVGRPDGDFLDPRVGIGEARRGCQGIVGFELDHRPHGDAHRGERFFQRVELGAQRGLDSCAGLVAGPQAIPERFDHVIGRDAEMSRTALDHLQHRLEHADDGAERTVYALIEAPQAVEMPKELVGAVDCVNDHAALCRGGARA
jgi:hypothetical protein